MAIRIPGTKIKIGKDKKKKAPNKKQVLDEAYRRILADPAASYEKKIVFPEMEPGIDEWYRPENDRMRKATAAGMMRASEAMFDDPSGYKLVFDHPAQDSFGGGSRAFSSSEGLVNMPSDIMGYMSKPQYLHSVLAHEVAHNQDQRENMDWLRKNRDQGHSIEKFRPKEKQSYLSAMLEPRYDPGTDVAPGGRNEYPDEYLSLGAYTPKYFRSLDVQDPTRGLKPVDPKKLAVELALQQRNFSSASGKTHRRRDSGPSRASLS